MLLRRLVFALFAFVAASAPGVARAQASPAEILFNRHAAAGTLQAGLTELGNLATANPSDATARMTLGFAQFVVAVEKLGQGFHRHGLVAPRTMLVPFLRLPVPENPSPEPLDYAKLRAIYTTLLADLALAEATLAAMPAGAAKFAADIHAVRLDMNSNGRGDDDERLDAILARLMRTSGPPGWEVAFDRADATWLRGYTQVLSGVLQFVLAHDWSDTYRQTAHLFFKGARQSSNPLHGEAVANPLLGRDAGATADAIAMLHLIRWPVAEPDRLKASHAHFKRVAALSRQNWREILAETDDDREWLPGPHQKSSAIGALQVSQAQVDGWLAVMDVFEAALDGRQLLGHWRFQKGVDLRAIFHEPQTFDLVLWLTGHAAVPYLKDGPTLDLGTSNRLTSVFGGNFLGFAFWFN
jgi:hypothetical protein